MLTQFAECQCAECHYAQCLKAECRYAECRVAFEAGEEVSSCKKPEQVLLAIKWSILDLFHTDPLTHYQRDPRNFSFMLN
jgi:hypothetical protein